MTPSLTFILLALVNIEAVFSYSQTPVQYYIQTDDGPNRYFRYQTLNGQYRKEKRFDDGTVVGIYGWVDPDGLLRLYDYVANDDGYKIVRERLSHVKVERPAEDNSVVSHNIKKKKKYKFKDDEKRRKKFVSAREQLKAQQNTPSPIETSTIETSTSSSGSLKEERPERKKLKPSFSPLRDDPSNNALVSPKSIPDLGYDKPGGKVTVDYDLGNNYRKEKTFPGGEVVGEHGYVDPFGILRVTSYSSGPKGHREMKTSYWIGSRSPSLRNLT